MSKISNPRVAIMREAIGKIVMLLTERKIQVTQRGHKAFVTYNDRTGEPKRVNLPYMPDDASNELLDAVQGFIDHEIGHIFFSDYKVLIKARAIGLAQLHNTIEDTYVERKMKGKFTGAAHNIGTTTAFFFKNYTDKELKKDPSRALGLLLVPAIRAWAGQREAIEYMDAEKWAVVQPVADKLGDLVKQLPDMNSSQDCLDLSIKFREAMNKGKEKKPEPPKDEAKPKDKDKGEATGGKGDTPEEFGEGPSDRPTDETGDEGSEDMGDFTDPEDRGIDDEHSDPSDYDDAEPDDGEGAETDEREPAKEHGDEPDDMPDAGDGSLDFSPDKAKEEEVKDESSPDDAGGEGGGTGDLSESDFKEEEDDDTVKDFDGGDADTPMGEGESEFEGDDAEGEFKEDDEADAASEALKKAFDDMPDYDDGLSDAISDVSTKSSKEADYIIWSKDFDKVEKFNPIVSHARAEPLVKAMTEQVDHMVGTIQKDLERAIAARTRSVWRPGLRKGKLNASSLARLTFGDDRVFRKREISTSKDVAVGLLIDCSGSMNYNMRIEKAALASYALSAVLDRMNISHEILGYTTQTSLPHEMRRDAEELGVGYSRTENLYMPIFKDFSERLTPDIKRRLALFPDHLSLRENVDGECVEIATQRLLRREESRKILMVLSDGEPLCPGNRGALRTHLKKVVNTATRAGVDIIGIGIETDDVRDFYPKSVVLNDVSDLTGTVVKQLRALLLAD